MLAGMRRVARGAAIAMAGLLVVMLAYSVWIALFRLEALILFIPISGAEAGEVMGRMSEYVDPWTSSTVMWSRTDSTIGAAAVIRLIGRVVRHRRGGARIRARRDSTELPSCSH